MNPVLHQCDVRTYKVSYTPALSKFYTL